MKKIKSIITAFAICILCTIANAQTVTVSDVEALPGETVSFTLNLTGGKADTYTAMQFDVQFPATGFSTTGDYEVSKLWKNATSTIGAVDASGVATIPVASSEAISAADVEGLLSVSFTVGNDVAIGEYDVTLTNLWFGYGTSSKDYLSDVTFKVNVVARHNVVLDENSTTAPEAATDVNVRVLRTINAGNWSTICLPFAMSEDQVKAAFGNDVQIADFTGYVTSKDADENIVGITVNFEAVTAIEANHPYIIKVTSPITEFTVNDVTIDPEDPCVSFGWTTGSGKNKVYHPNDFKGTYVADFDIYSDAVSYPLFLSENMFYYATENTQHMNAFRGYFDFDDYLAEAEPAVRMLIFVDGEETRIEGLSTTEAEGIIYDLNGRKVSKPQQHGVYIVNCMKVLK